MTQDIYNSIREILLCDEDIDFCCKLLLKITFNCDDWKWIQNVCIDIINSNREKNICGLAVTCIGHLARIHGKIEKERIFEVFNQQKDNPFINDRIGDAIDDIDMFDEDFFMYYEDVDLSFRAQLAGWKVRFTPKAIAYHKVGASSKKVPGLAVYNTFKNLPLVFIKNVPGKLFWYIGIRFLLTYWLIFASAIRHGSGWPAFKGALVSIIHKPAAYKKRLHIQKNRKVSVDYIRNIIHDGPLPNQTGLLKFKHFFRIK